MNGRMPFLVDPWMMEDNHLHDADQSRVIIDRHGRLIRSQPIHEDIAQNNSHEDHSTDTTNVDRGVHPRNGNF